MRYTPQHKSNTHRKIVAVASEMFRSQGIGNVGVTDLMQRAGLTHGGFYAHFNSKDALAVEATRSAFEESAQRLKQQLEESVEGLRFSSAVQRYLSSTHRDTAAKGCVAAALAAEVARQTGPVRDAMSAGIRRLIEAVQKMIEADGLNVDAHAALATMVGALVLSRAVSDSKLSERLLSHARDSLLSPSPKRSASTKTTASKSGGKRIRS
jgi:TetR/AcrR family transcriptional repressor of nem operon